MMTGKVEFYVVLTFFMRWQLKAALKAGIR
jgi:hypothetical protein